MFCKNLLESDMLVYQNRSPDCDNCYKTSYHASLSYHGYIDADIECVSKKKEKEKKWETFRIIKKFAKLDNFINAGTMEARVQGRIQNFTIEKK